ncbi:MAG TPA: hypothetical protein VIC71_03240 [Gammaproteobacteria bacterium]
MEPSGLPQLIALIITIALLVIGWRRLGLSLPDLLTQLNEELLQRKPVYSAETIKRKEAEFIRDRLPKKIPMRTILLLVVIGGAAAWWLGS